MCMYIYMYVCMYTHTHIHTHTHTQAELYILLWNFLQDILFSYKKKEQNGVYSLLPFKFEKEEERLPWWLSGTESACQCRRREFDPWSGKTPYATEQLSLCSGARELQLLKPVCPGACAPRQEKRSQREVCAPQLESSPHHGRKKSPHSSEDAAQPKIKK